MADYLTVARELIREGDEAYAKAAAALEKARAEVVAKINGAVPTPAKPKAKPRKKSKKARPGHVALGPPHTGVYRTGADKLRIVYYGSSGKQIWEVLDTLDPDEATRIRAERIAAAKAKLAAAEG